MTSKQTAKILADRTRETELAHASLESARAAELTAERAAQTDPSSAARTTWDAASESRKTRERDHQLAAGRADRAREAHEAQLRAERDEERSKIAARSAPDAVVSASFERIRAHLTPFLASFAKLLEDERKVFRAQREDAARYRELARVDGINETLEEAALDDVCVVNGVALGMLGAKNEAALFLTPIADPNEIGGDVFERAMRLVKGTNE